MKIITPILASLCFMTIISSEMNIHTHFHHKNIQSHTDKSISNIQEMFAIDSTVYFISNSNHLYFLDDLTIRRIHFDIDTSIKFILNTESSTYIIDEKWNKYKVNSNSSKEISLELLKNDTFQLSQLYTPTYIDEEYIIECCCKGEWGGLTFFRNRLTNRIKTLQSTCPKEIVKSDGKFFILNGLRHLGANYSSIQLVENPDSLKTIKLNPLQGYCTDMLDNRNAIPTNLIYASFKLEVLTIDVINSDINILFSKRNKIYSGKIENGVITSSEMIFNSDSPFIKIKRWKNHTKNYLYIETKNEESNSPDQFIIQSDKSFRNINVSQIKM